MKKTMIVALSALMLAGALNAIEGATSRSTAAIVIGEGPHQHRLASLPLTPTAIRHRSGLDPEDPLWKC